MVIVDFKSYNGKHEFNFTEYAPGFLHFIKGDNIEHPRLGSNGSGKSTIWDALCWCLYGKTVRELKNPDIKPWRKGGHPRVTVYVKIDGELQRVTRSLSPNRLMLNGEDVGQASLERLLGMNFDLMTNTIILGQGRPLFFDMQPRQKMELFTLALDLDRWDGRAELAADAAKAITNAMSELDDQLTALKATKRQVDDTISQVTIRADEWEGERQERSKTRAKRLKELRAQLEPAEKAHGKVDLELEAAEIEARHYERKLGDRETDLLELDREVQEAAIAHRDWEDKLKAAERELRDLGKGDVCESCGQSLKGTALEKHRRTLEKRIRAMERNEEPQSNWDKATKRRARVANDVIQLREWYREFTDKATKARDSLDTLTKNVAELRAQVKAIEGEQTAHDEERNPHTGQLVDLRKQRKRVLATIDECKDMIDAAQIKLDRHRYWVKGFKDVRLYVLEEVLRELEVTTNSMLDAAGLIGWRVEYDVERETKRGTIARALTIMIKSPKSRGMVKWEAWSGGEAQRLRVVGTLALSQVLLNRAGVKCNIEVLDEPTQHLSTEGVYDLADYLSERAAELHRRIFYLDQTSVRSDAFETVTTIEHTKAGSRIR
jgi:DNA repair exonuclease SbcCD ATPase subunit